MLCVTKLLSKPQNWTESLEPPWRRNVGINGAEPSVSLSREIVFNVLTVANKWCSWMDYKQISRFINHRQSKEDLVPGNESVLALQHTTNTDKQAYILDEVRAPQIGKLTIKQ
jgi:hypothetical protein